jgi:hypothetical protein
MYVYACNKHTHTHIYMYSDACTEPPLRAAVPTPKTPAQASACTCAHARAHRRCRRAQPAAPHRSPAERVRRSACNRAASGAYPVHVRHRRGVPRADVRVERRRRPERLRAEPPAVHVDGGRAYVSAPMRGRPIARAHARARTQHVRECVRRARIGDPFVGVARRAWI